MLTTIRHIDSDALKWNENFTVHVRVKNYSNQAGNFKLQIILQALGINQTDTDPFSIGASEVTMRDRMLSADKGSVPEHLQNSAFFTGSVQLYEISDNNEENVIHGAEFYVRNADFQG